MQNNTSNIEERIISEARRLFVEKGYTGTSMSEIAEATGLTRSSLHYYYHTKDSLFQAVFSSILASFIPKIQEIMTTDKPIGERIENLVDTYLEKLQDNPYLPLFLIREANRDPEHLLASIKDMGLLRYFVEISRHLQTEMNEGKLRPVPMYTIVFTFYGLLLVPFIFQNVARKLLSGGNEEEYIAIIQDWKPYFVSEMDHLLNPASSAPTVPGDLQSPTRHTGRQNSPISDIVSHKVAALQSRLKTINPRQRKKTSIHASTNNSNVVPEVLNSGEK